ncbi:hypothetical protein PCE1_002453 [Barthelona sp. PCE]
MGRPASIQEFTAHDFRELQKRFGSEPLNSELFAEALNEVSDVSKAEAHRIFARCDTFNSDLVDWSSFISFCIESGLVMDRDRYKGATLNREEIDEDFGHRRSVDALVFLSEIGILISSSRSGGCKVWSAADKRLIATLQEPPLEISRGYSIAPNMEIGPGNLIEQPKAEIVTMQELELYSKPTGFEPSVVKEFKDSTLGEIAGVPNLPNTNGVPLRYTKHLRRIARPDQPYTIKELHKAQELRELAMRRDVKTNTSLSKPQVDYLLRKSTEDDGRKHDPMLRYGKPAAKALGGWITDGVYDPDAEVAFFGTLGATVLTYNTSSWTITSQHRVPRTPLCMELIKKPISNTNAVLYGDTAGYLSLFDVESRQLTHTNAVHGRNWVNTLCTHPLLGIISGDLSGRICISDSERLLLERSFKAHNLGVTGVDLSWTLKLISTSSLDRTVKIWDPYSKDIVHSFESHKTAFLDCYFHDQSYSVFGIASDKKILVYDVRMWRKRQTISDSFVHQPIDAFTSAAYDRNRGILATAGNVIRFWTVNNESSQVVTKMQDVEPPVFRLRQSLHPHVTAPVGKQVEEKKVSSLHTSKPIALLYVAFLNNLLVVDEKGMCSLWRLGDGQLLHSFSCLLPGQQIVTAASLDPNGRLLIVAATADGVVSFFNFNSGQQVFTFPELGTEITKLTILEDNPNFACVATGWHGLIAEIPHLPRLGQQANPVQVLMAHKHDIDSCCIIKDSYHDDFATISSEEGIIVIWQIHLNAPRLSFEIPCIGLGISPYPNVTASCHMRRMDSLLVSLEPEDQRSVILGVDVYSEKPNAHLLVKINSSIIHMTINNKETLLFVTTADGELIVFDLGSSDQRFKFSGVNSERTIDDIVIVKEISRQKVGLVHTVQLIESSIGLLVLSFPDGNIALFKPTSTPEKIAMLNQDAEWPDLPNIDELNALIAKRGWNKVKRSFKMIANAARLRRMSLIERFREQGLLASPKVETPQIDFDFFTPNDQ